MGASGADSGLGGLCAPRPRAEWRLADPRVLPPPALRAPRSPAFPRGSAGSVSGLGRPCAPGVGGGRAAAASASGAGGIWPSPAGPVTWHRTGRGLHQAFPPGLGLPQAGSSFLHNHSFSGPLFPSFTAGERPKFRDSGKKGCALGRVGCLPSLNSGCCSGPAFLYWGPASLLPGSASLYPEPGASAHKPLSEPEAPPGSPRLVQT